ncbi:MAG: rane protein [Herbaspirillum sp.]|nr:rane protein [Herbaspirillum sp.]
MHYALDIRTFIFSHYFYTGIRIAIGVVGLTLLVMYGFDLATAMTVCIGALCTSLMDLPSPLRHKFNEMLASVLLCTMVALIVSLCAPFHWALRVALVIVSFTASMMVVYGKKSIPLQFAALFIMTISIDNDLTAPQALRHSALFFCGGMSYLAYSMTVSWFLRRRIKQQILAEALFELARYLRIKADFYDVRSDLTAQFNLLVRQQIMVAEKQQTSRDLILRDMHTKQDGLLVHVHLVMLELYEQILTTHTDYALLRSYFSDNNVMVFLRDIANKAALDIEGIAYAVTRKRASVSSVNYLAEMRAIQFELQQLQQDNLAGQIPDEALTLLRTTYEKIGSIIESIEALHTATRNPVDPLPLLPGMDMTPFLTQQKYQFGILLKNLRWESPVFRFAIRVMLAVSCGLWVSDHLPYTAHGYWIVLTIVVILKPNYSMTKQRRTDRLIGTMIGCVLTAFILNFVHEPVALMALLFVVTAAAPAFIYIKYRYTAIAASMQILLQINILIPSSHAVIGERLIDTVLGALIATAFSYVLPSWEYRALPRLLNAVLQASQKYIQASRDMLEGKVNDDFFYRVGRKGFMDSLSLLISSLVRMMDEPLSKQHAVREINRFVVQNYLVAAHIAAMRVLLRRHADGLPREQVNDVVEHACDDTIAALTRAQRIINPAVPGRVSEASTDPVAAEKLREKVREIPALNPPAPEVAGWSGWYALQRRAALLDNDAREIVMETDKIKHVLRKA